MNRSSILESISGGQQKWDIIVVGGGATGLGCALDASTRGYKTLLLEKHDFSKGTSSRSTKLVHGGVRYLKQGNLSLVFGALRERGLMQQNAPHVVTRQSFIVPGYSQWDKIFYGTGLKLYDMLAGRLSFGRSRVLSKDETVKAIPTIKTDQLKGGVEYYDGQFDDARLSVDLMKTIFDHEGTALNYMTVDGLSKSNGQIDGVHATDVESNNSYHFKSSCVINATGVFSDSLRKMDHADQESIIQPSQGVHIVLDKSFLPGSSAMMIPKTADGRVLFAVPWKNRIVVGTTDTPVQEANAEPRATENELEFLLTHTAKYLNKAPEPNDIKSVFTGLRPLVRSGNKSSTKSISRDHTILKDPSGLITITGGKWTTYRKMAEETVDLAAESAGLPAVPCKTKELPISGADSSRQNEAPASQDPDLLTRIHPELPCSRADIHRAVRHEMAQTVEDVLSRRTRSLLIDAKASLEIAEPVAKEMATELDKDQEWMADQVTRFKEVASAYLYDELLNDKR